MARKATVRRKRGYSRMTAVGCVTKVHGVFHNDYGEERLRFTLLITDVFADVNTHRRYPVSMPLQCTVRGELASIMRRKGALDRSEPYVFLDGTLRVSFLKCSDRGGAEGCGRINPLVMLDVTDFRVLGEGASIMSKPSPRTYSDDEEEVVLPPEKHEVVGGEEEQKDETGEPPPV